MKRFALVVIVFLIGITTGVLLDKNMNIQLPMGFTTSEMSPGSQEEARKKLAAIGVSFDRMIFFMKVIDGDMLAIQLLLEAGMDPNTSDGGETVLNMAAKGHRPEVVKSLLEHGADPNLAARPGGETPIVSAAEFGNSEIVKLLMAKGANINPPNGTRALSQARQQGNQEIVQLLQNAGAR